MPYVRKTGKIQDLSSVMFDYECIIMRHFHTALCVRNITRVGFEIVIEFSQELLGGNIRSGTGLSGKEKSNQVLI